MTETARVCPLLLILEVSLALAQLWDSKQMLGGGGCWELLQMVVHLFPKASATKSSQLGQPR